MKSIYEKLNIEKEKYDIDIRDGITQKELNEGIKKIEKLVSWKLPDEYVEFINLSNGMGICDYNCKIEKLDTVISIIEIMKDEIEEKGCFDIGVFWEDDLFIDQNNKIYLSFQGIDEPVCIHMTLKEFLNKNIENDFEIFWDESINIVK